MSNRLGIQSLPKCEVSYVLKLYVEKVIQNLTTFESPFSSFAKWRDCIDPIDMTLAGFSFTNAADISNCFNCKIEIFEWLCTISWKHSALPRM